jgi:23S rRNA pseudouridine2605 synthase
MGLKGKGLNRKNPISADRGIRLQVYLARSGLGSRRSCEELIRDGRIAINGERVIVMGVKVLPGDKVTIDGKVVTPAKDLVYVALHKPRGYICANADPHGRPLASDLFKPVVKERLFHVGRLDFLSTGLIFYTNDGDFTRRVSHPGTRIEKEYLIEAARKIDESFLKQYRKGIRVGDTVYHCVGFTLRSDHSALITLLEGKNREIRNVFASRNIRLKKVHRIRIGAVTLKGIAPGRFRKLTEREVRWFFNHDGSGD